MNKLHKIVGYWYLIPVLLAFAFTLALSLTYTHSVGVDIHFHLSIAEQYAKGDFLEAFAISYRIDKLVYPPLFHFLLVPSIWIGEAYLFTLILQASLLPLGIFTFEYLTEKVLGVKAAFLGGFLMLGSWAYTDRVTQVIPHSISMILFPLALLYALQNQPRSYIKAAAVMVWTHGLVALSALGGTLTEKFWRKEWRTIGVFLVTTSVIIGLSLWFLPSALQGYGSSYCTNQEKSFWTKPVVFFVMYVGVLTLGFAVAFYRLYQRIRGVPISRLAIICMATIVATAVMIPVWADRWIQVCTVPLGLLMLEFYSQRKGYFRFVIAMWIIFYFIWVYSQYWVNLGAFQS